MSDAWNGVVDFSNLESISAEWPQSHLDPVSDLANYQHALVLYDQDDYPTMMQCATLFARALAHLLYGPGILQGNEVPNTVHKALYCSLCAPPDGRTFAEDARRSARLAMTVMREYSWQPSRFGGKDPRFDGFFDDRGNYLLMVAAIAPPSEPWAGDINAFFAVPPRLQPSVQQSLEPPPLEAPLNRLAPAQTSPIAPQRTSPLGDAIYEEGRALLAKGQEVQAMEKFAEAGEAGSVEAVVAGADLCKSLGLQDQANGLYEAAANAGHPVAMFNTAIAAQSRGDRRTAHEWFERAAGSGFTEAFAALTQFAHDDQDTAAEMHWAELGAEAGHIFCLARFGLLLVYSAHGDRSALQRARGPLEQAAAMGDIDSAGLAVHVNHELGDSARAQHFVTLITEDGNPEAIDRLRRYGYL